MPHPDEARSIAAAAMDLAEQAANAPAPIPGEPQRSGTWVPTDASGAGLALVVDSATWVRQGKLVIARTLLTYPVTASGAVAVLAGLPFRVDNSEAARQGLVSYATIAALRYTLPVLNAFTANFYDNAGAGMTNVQLSAGSLYLAFIYTTADP